MQWTQFSHLSTEAFRNIQERKLRFLMQHELPFSPFYRALFEKNHIQFADIKTLDDLQRVPFTSKVDLAPTEEDRAKPRQFILQPDEHLIKQFAPKGKLIRMLMQKLSGQDVKRKLEWEYKPIHMHFTTGRTALPTPFVYSARDLEMLKESGERMLDVARVSRDLVAINAFPYAPHLAFWLAFFALTTVGMTSVQTGGGKIMGTQKIIDAIERLKASLLLFIPGYGYHMLREAVNQKRDFSNVQYVITGGERVSAGMRERVKAMLRQLGAKNPIFYSTYAFTEGKTAWIQCAEGAGYHVYPDMEYFEVIDKDGKRVKDGGPGELVYTSLDWRGSVVVRYRTGDMTQGIEYGACEHCGKTVPRIKPDIQRTSEIKEFHLTKIKGELVNLNNLYPILTSIPEIEEWQVEIRKEHDDPYGLDELIIHLATQFGASWKTVEQTVAKRLRDEMFVSVTIKQHGLPGLLEMIGMETEVKEKRIVDNRPKE